MRSFAEKSVYLNIAILVALGWMCFSRTLGNYFIADDFAEISYVSSIFHGHPDLFWSNFTGNYMQVSGMQVYRPGLLVTIVLDWLIYGTKAWGYYLTNLIYFSGDICALYLVCRNLSAQWLRSNSLLFAFFSTALFAVSPLHCEAISWMVERGDLAAALFYLLALLFFVRTLTKTNFLSMALAVGFFVIALSIKELPIGLPVVATVIAFFWKANTVSFPLRAIQSLRTCLPLWITFVSYFTIRYLCIGTMTGGYVGGVGAQQLSAMLAHWGDADTIQRLILPVTAEVARQAGSYLTMLRALDTLVIPLIALRIISGCWSWQWVFLMSALITTMAAPLFQLWGLGPNLEGSRFYFFLSMPLSMLLPLLLFHPSKTSNYLETSELNSSIAENPGKPAVNPGKYGRALTSLSIAIQIALLFVLGRIAVKSNMLWVHAGREDLHMSQQCQKLAETISKQKKIVLLGIPDDFHGAHMILNSTMFEVMLQPPFVSPEVASRFLTTMPLMYGPEQYVNGSRLRALLARPDVAGPYTWVRGTQAFKLVPLPSVQKQDLKNLPLPNPASNYPLGYTDGDQRANTNYSITLDNLNLNPLLIDCVEFDMVATGLKDDTVKVSWTGDAGTLPPPGDELFVEPAATYKAARERVTQKVRIRVGHFWRWYADGRIKSIVITPPQAKSCHITNIRLLPYEAVAPELTVDSAQKDHYQSVMTANKTTLNLSPGLVSGAASMQLEISKNNFFFDNFVGRTDIEPVAFKIPLPKDARTFTLEKEGKYFPASGFYQLRLRCLDLRGAPIDEYSDLVTLMK